MRPCNNASGPGDFLASCNSGLKTICRHFRSGSVHGRGCICGRAAKGCRNVFLGKTVGTGCNGNTTLGTSTSHSNRSLICISRINAFLGLKHGLRAIVSPH